jgi:tetratricopeptide (TPR) repeat protein
MAEGVLTGETLAARGEIEAALEAIAAAVALEDALEYDEPEPWTIPVRHHMGGILLDAGRAAEAESVYRRALEIHPGTGWSLHGLAAALRAQGSEAQAAEVEARFAEAWKRADVWISGSRF